MKKLPEWCDQHTHVPSIPKCAQPAARHQATSALTQTPCRTGCEAPISALLTTQAIAGWRLIADRYAKLPFSPTAAASAIEDGAMHVHTLAARDVGSQWTLHEETDTQDAMGSLCPSLLDDIASSVRQAHSDVFRCALLAPCSSRWSVCLRGPWNVSVFL